MNKKIIIGIIVAVIIAIVIGLVIFLNGKNKSNLEINSVDDMKALVNNIYSGLEEVIPPTVNTTEVTITDANSVKSYTGLDSVDGIESIVASEPMISSQAYSLVIVKTVSDKVSDEIAKKMNENINANKWLCVSAEKVYSTSSGNIAMLVMASEDWAKPVYEKFKNLAGSIGPEYQRSVESGIF